ncbi:hypothetical protein PHYPSEUDO_015082 [Phytophthora pseudosyringae]|uniref:CHAT domain-containing protein n=1 Tax=Phytophthora pseudosyringae TaxID=221518 RepID=A0A8T1WL36_9STRA|nr:hypothetical protein PHYPSEUDO_015082 [Phytophthora pseudosyringae]
MSSTAASSSPLEHELWAFVESLAAPPAAPALSLEVRLEQIQQQARDLLTRRLEAASVNGTDEFPAAPAAAIAASGDADAKDDAREVAATSEAEEKMYEAVNERIARRMIDGVETPNRGAATASTSEDKSDTLSDCTTITETSSVYGIHNTWVDLATLYSLPFVMRDSNRRLKPVPPLNIAQEQSHLNKIFQECQRAVHTMRAVATVDALRKVLDRGVTVLHFSGHGGRIIGHSQYLMFEDTQCSGLAHLADSATLRSILNGGTSSPSLEETSVSENSVSLEVTEDGAPPVSELGFLSRSASQISSSRSNDGRPAINGTLKLVFVSSCDSRDIGEVFVQAGVAHVVCVRSEGRVLDESSAMFSYSFYHAALTGKTVQQAFEIARVRVSAEMRIPDGEGNKFVLLESSQLHAETCPLWSSEDIPQAIEVNFDEKSCRCNASTQQFVFSDISVGKWVDVSPSNKFCKTLPAISESFVGREQELHMLAELVNTRRLVTLRGPPGIGKSTLSIKLAHFLADRNAFPDGVAFIRLRGAQSLEGMESAIKSALFPEGGREKDMPLDQALADLRVLLVMDNMEDPINANPSAIRDFLLQLLQNTPSLSFLMTARQAMGGGINEFDEKVVSLNRLSHYHAADLFIKKSPRALLVSEIGDIDTSGAKSTSILEALVAHPLMAFLDGHPQAISLCAPLLQDRSLSELTRAVLSRGVSELQVVGLAAHDRSALNTLVASLDVSLEQVRMHHGQDAIRFFALLGLLPAGAMPADFKSLWGSNWEELVETLLRFSLIQRNRIPGFALAKRGLPKRSGIAGTSGIGSSSRRSRSRHSSNRGYDQSLLAALKSYSDFISNATEGAVKTENAEYDIPNGRGGSRRVLNDRNMINSLTRSGRASRVSEHVERMDDQVEIMAVCVSYSTFPFIASYARSLLGMYDGDGAKNEVLESLCVADRDLFLYNTSRHFRKVSYWVFQHICTLTIESSAAYLILDLHESNLWMILDLHIRMIEEWQAESKASSPIPSRTSPDVCLTADSDGINLREKIAGYVMDVACYLAHSLFLSGRHRGAWNAANKALHIAKQHKNSMCQANIRKLMGILLTSETKSDEAKAQFGTALILYKTVGNKIGQAASLSAIGMIHARNGNLRGAHNCFTKALTLYEWFKHSLGQLNCHQRLANLEKKLRDGDGSAHKNGPNSGHSHHYAATRRLQGDLNRKRNGEYIVRWVGHETSLLLELPSPVVEDDSQSRPGQSLAISSQRLPFPLGTAAKPTAPGVTNTPKKGKLSTLIEHKENDQTTSTTSSVSTSAATVEIVASSEGQGDKFKNSSFAKRKEYDSSIRKSAAAAMAHVSSSTSTPEP